MLSWDFHENLAQQHSPEKVTEWKLLCPISCFRQMTELQHSNIPTLEFLQWLKNLAVSSQQIQGNILGEICLRGTVKSDRSEGVSGEEKSNYKLCICAKLSLICLLSFPQGSFSYVKTIELRYYKIASPPSPFGLWGDFSLPKCNMQTLRVK